jgi:hypothetical protein
MTPRERPISASLIKEEFRKAAAKLRAKRKKEKLRAEREVIDLQLKTLSDCERLLWDIMLI